MPAQLAGGGGSQRQRLAALTSAGSPCADCLGLVRQHAAADGVYVLSLYDASSAASQQEAQRWVADTARRVQELAAATAAGADGVQPASNGCLEHRAGGGGGASADAAQPVRGVAQQPPGGSERQQGPHEGRQQPGPFRLREGRQRYLKNIAACMQVWWSQQRGCTACRHSSGCCVNLCI